MDDNEIPIEGDDDEDDETPYEGVRIRVDDDAPAWKRGIALVASFFIVTLVLIAEASNQESDTPKLNRDGPGYALLTNKGHIFPEGKAFAEREDAEAYKRRLTREVAYFEDDDLTLVKV